jgi:translation initiation factor 3 subunit B
VESFEIKDTCYSFAWEPNGQKFAVIYGDSPTRTTAVFYRIISGTPAKAGKIEMMKEFKNRSVIQTSWSPQGNYCVLASTIPKQQSVTSHAEFYDVSSNEVQLMNKIEHEYMSDFEWDPTGRYFVTYVSFWNHKVRFGNSFYLLFYVMNYCSMRFRLKMATLFGIFKANNFKRFH